MASTLVREMLNAGIHFGHHASRWNPKMKPYIYGKRNGIHILDIRETLRGLLRGQKFLSRIVASGGDVLFVGTKRQARDSVEAHARATGMPWVNERWLGGMLTNFRTIRSRLKRLEELEALMDSPAWETGYSKKMKSQLTREHRKIKRNLEGIRNMGRPPVAMVVVDVRKEYNALREARSLGIPSVCLIDSDSDPDEASIPIPGNDDSMRSIELIIGKLAEAIEEGKRARPEKAPDDQADAADEADAQPMRRRPRRGAPREGAPRDRAPQPEQPVAAPVGNVPAADAAAAPAPEAAPAAAEQPAPVQPETAQPASEGSAATPPTADAPDSQPAGDEEAKQD